MAYKLGVSSSNLYKELRLPSDPRMVSKLWLCNPNLCNELRLPYDSRMVCKIGMHNFTELKELRPPYKICTIIDGALPHSIHKYSKEASSPISSRSSDKPSLHLIVKSTNALSSHIPLSSFLTCSQLFTLNNFKELSYLMHSGRLPNEM